MQKLFSLFQKPQATLRHYRLEMRRGSPRWLALYSTNRSGSFGEAGKEALVIKQGREQFLRLIEKGLRVPVALF